MNIRKIFIICAVILAVCVNFYAQNSWEKYRSGNSSKSEKAEKVDEFGRTNECDRGARLDNLFIHLLNDSTLRGVVIVYKGTDVLPANYESRTDRSLIRFYRNQILFRNFDASRIEFIEGGFRNTQMTELWIVPSGVVIPKPSETVLKPELPTNKTFLYDQNHLADISYNEIDYLEEYLLPSVKAEREAEQREFEEYLKSEETSEIETTEEIEPEQPKTPEEIEAEKFFWANERFGEVIKDQKDASGVIIFYADDQIYDINKLQTFIDEGRRKIAKEASISPAKIQIVFGGYRSSVEAEFWIMPKNGAFPTPTPETRPVEEPEDETDEENL